MEKLVAIILPFTILVGGYLVIYGLTTGIYELGRLKQSREEYAKVKQDEGEENAKQTKNIEK